MSYDIEAIRQSPRQFVDMETVEWLSDRVINLEQQLDTKDAQLQQAGDLLTRLQVADDMRIAGLESYIKNLENKLAEKKLV